jgi:hypothetical protein
MFLGRDVAREPVVFGVRRLVGAFAFSAGDKPITGVLI